MSTEFLTGLVTGIAATAGAGGLTALWTANRLINRRRDQDAAEAPPERDLGTGLYTWKGFIAAVEDLTVTAAAMNPKQNRLILLECNGLADVDDTYGHEAFLYVRRAFIDALKLLAGVDGFVGHGEGERTFVVLGSEQACRFIADGKLWASVIDVATPDPADDPCHELRQFGHDYLGARHCFDPPMDDVETFDEIRCEVRAGAAPLDRESDLGHLIGRCDSALHQAIRSDMHLVRARAAESLAAV